MSSLLRDWTSRFGPAQLAAAVVAMLGVLIMLVSSASRLSAAQATSTTIDLRPQAPLLVLSATRPGDDEATVTVRPRVEADAEVFVALARDRDLAAFLEGATWDEASSSSSSALSHHEGTAKATDPRGSDIWVALSDQTGPVPVDWPATETGMRVLVAADGVAAAPAVELSWTHAAREAGIGWPPVVGAILGLGALVVLVGLRMRSGWFVPARAPSATSSAPPPPVPPPPVMSRPFGDAPTQMLNRRDIAAGMPPPPTSAPTSAPTPKPTRKPEPEPEPEDGQAPLPFRNNRRRRS